MCAQGKGEVKKLSLCVIPVCVRKGVGEEVTFINTPTYASGSGTQ